MLRTLKGVGRPLGTSSSFIDNHHRSQDEAPPPAAPQVTSDVSAGAVESMGAPESTVRAAALALHYAIPLLDHSEWPSQLILTDRLSTAFLRNHHLLPIRLENDGSLVLAVGDPGNSDAVAAVEVACEARVTLRVAPAPDIITTLERLAAEAPDGNLHPIDSFAPEDDEDIDHLKDLALDAPVIELVNRFLHDAVVSRATDLHIEPARGKFVVRKRVDGMLREAGTMAPAIGRAAVSRLKILSQLNIAERRLPQDGRARVKINDHDCDLRLATMPTIHGEGVALRFLSTASEVPELGRLGINTRDEARLRTAITAPHGLIVITGPTGSGKTTTLAAILSMLNEPSRKIITIEDPVEYPINGLTQIQVKPDIGITFASALRSFLRYDPDVIMVGEMRDNETARIAVHAALTGHLVVTTLHTNSAAGAVTRLLDMGVQGYLLASTLKCAVAQRLVRTLCTRCRIPALRVPALPRELLMDAGYQPGRPMKLWTTEGCEQCGHTGYFGRAAIFEVLHVDEPIQQLMRQDVSASMIAAAGRSGGMTTMMADGIAKSQAGITSVEEVARAAVDI